jgi:hypothetical protein
MFKGYHVLDGHKILNTYPESVNQLRHITYLDLYFNKYYRLAEKIGVPLENDLSIVLGDWRKFDPNYDPEAIFRAIEEEGRQGREFKRKFYAA